MKLILASKSPRRKELMEKAGYEFDIIASDGEMDISGKTYSDELLISCVESKIVSVLEKLDSGEYKILLADTVVVLDNKIIGKPKGKDDAIKTLQSLSNKTHFVATAVMVAEVKNKNIVSKNEDIDKTYVTFRKIDINDIIKYIDTENPLDKAGSYGIQDKSFNFVTKIEGELDNVIGLPMKVVERLI